MENLLQDVKNKPYVVISPDTLRQLLDTSQIIEEHDTMISDKIRLLKYNSLFLVQEKTDKGEYLVRGFESELAARDFIMKRMKIYEDMWDGCGCKIYYYE